MPLNILLPRPEDFLGWFEYCPIRQGEHVAGQVCFAAYPFGDQHLVVLADSHQPFVKRPLAQAAQGQAVCRPVVICLPPGDDMGCLNHGMSVRGQHAEPHRAQRCWYKVTMAFRNP